MRRERGGREVGGGGWWWCGLTGQEGWAGVVVTPERLPTTFLRSLYAL